MRPLTKFSSDFDAEKVTNVIYERLDELKLITSNIKSTITETFGELANNAIRQVNSSSAWRPTLASVELTASFRPT